MTSSKNMWLLLSGVFVSESAAWIGTIGSLQFLSETLDSRFYQSAILVSGALFGIFLSPYAGRIIDSFHPKRILLFSGIIRMLAIALMMWAIWSSNVWFMVAFQMIIVIASTFYFPTINAVIPALVPERQLMRANMLNFNLATVARILGTALGGVLITFISLEHIFILSGLIYLLLIALTLMLRMEYAPHPHTNKNRQKPAFSELFQLMRAEPAVPNLLILTCIPFLFIGGLNLFTIEISEQHQMDSLKGIIYAVEGTSILVAGVFMKRLTARWGKSNILFAGAFAVIVSLLALIPANMPLQLAAFSLFGLASGLFIPLSNMEAQVLISKDALGRFFSFKRMIETTTIQVSLIFTGMTLDLLSLPALLLIYAALSMAAVLIARRRFRAALSLPRT